MNKFKKSQQVFIIASGIIVILFFVIALAIGGLLVNKNTSIANSPFDEKFVLQQQPSHDDNYSDKDFKKVQELMEQQAREMEALHNQMMYSSPFIAQQPDIPDPSAPNVFRFNFNTPSLINMENLPDKYVVTINLNENIDENSININVEETRINVRVVSRSKGKYGVSTSTVQESLGFDSPVDVSKVKRETVDNKHIITIPKKVPDMVVPDKVKPDNIEPEKVEPDNTKPEEKKPEKPQKPDFSKYDFFI